jgi:predicted enzyme related to lactoylglutathione lyase
MDMGPEMGTYQMYGLKGKTLGGMFNKPKQMPGPPAWLPYKKVPDSKKAAETVKRLGGQVENGHMEAGRHHGADQNRAGGKRCLQRNGEEETRDGEEEAC